MHVHKQVVERADLSRERKPAGMRPAPVPFASWLLVGGRLIVGGIIVSGNS